MIWSILCSLAFAQRPTSGGMFSFSADDVVETYDFEMIRVHYSVEGPNLVKQGDADEDGVPDFAQMVAEEANAVLEFYAEQGFRYPISESEMGFGALGGSEAFDFYLVDFAGNSDGMFGVDGCAGMKCSGYMVMENDFRGYNYPSIAEAIEVLTSHELFHAVQAAYNANQPSWLSEGSAVWAEWLYNPNAMDFYWFSSAYLEDPTRSIDRPPAGVTTSFSYGTAIFYAFMDEYYQEQRMVAVQEDLEGLQEEDMIQVVVDHMDDVKTDWMQFAQWNLATGDLAGAMDSYSFAGWLDGIPTEAQGETISEDHRFYPLAATYFLLEHSGGTVNFVYLEDAQDVQFSLHPTNDAGQVLAPVKEWKIGEESIFSLELEAGEYWLVGALPILADSSQKIEFCLGGDCVLPADAEPSTEPSDEGKGACQTMNATSDMILLFSLSLMGMVRRRKC